MLENKIFQCNLDVYEFKVYAYLCMRADRKTMTCFPSAQRIALDCNISESQVRKVTSSLEKKGFISKQRRYLKTLQGKNHQTSNLYHTEPLPACCEDTPSISDRHPLSDIESINKNHYNKKVRLWI